MDHELPLQTCTEKINFGELFGDFEICQCSAVEFHRACLQSNSNESDNTGLRIHAGAHVAIRFLLRYPILISGKKVIELGCGTGVFGLVSTRLGTVTSYILLTDGSEESIKMAHTNVYKSIPECDGDNLHNKIGFAQLMWGSKSTINKLFVTEVS